MRERSDWEKCVYTAQAGFRALGTDFLSPFTRTPTPTAWAMDPVTGGPTNAGKSTMNTYIAKALGSTPLDLRTGARVERVLVEDWRGSAGGRS